MAHTEFSIPIVTDNDIVSARQQARELAKNSGFSSSELAVIATAISELARNIVSYAKNGTVSISLIEEKGKSGIQIVAQDQGPGIQDLHLAMQEGYSTSNSLGLGLPGVQRLMDSFEINSVIGKGTTIIVRKWVFS
ncbi:MAG: anti-sigma regulatory factor [Gammaproteobacteria bacterium]|nr:MAG: anti-sigma regulatory factor [Gammaproteobacteria bacterium]